MRIQIESTTKLITLCVNGAEVPARLWEGHTESGIPVHCYITRIAAHAEDQLQEFQRELQECREPSEELLVIPLRLIL